MAVTDLLLEALEKLGDKDFETFKWYLSNKLLEGFTPIPNHRLEKKERPFTVSELTQRYGDEPAVIITVTVLRKMNQNAAALALERAYTA